MKGIMKLYIVIVIMILIISACQLFYPPDIYEEIVQKQSSSSVESSSSAAISTNDMPVITVNYPSNNMAVSNNIMNISGTAVIGSGFTISQIELNINNGVYFNIGTNFTNINWSTNAVVFLSNQTNTLQAMAVGNTGKTSVSPVVTVIVDSVPPVISGITPASGSTNGSGYTFGGTVIDAMSGISNVEVQQDGGSFGLAALSGNTWLTNFSGLTSGSHTNIVCAYDNAGNKSANYTNIVVTLSDVPSVTVNAQFINLITNTAAINLSGLAYIDTFYSIASTNVAVSINGGAYQAAVYTPVSSNWTFLATLTANLSNTVMVRAIGSSDKTNYSSTNYIIMDTISPVIFNVLATNGEDVGSNFTFTISVTDNLAGVDKAYASIGGGAMPRWV